ncbi:MAG TPA: lipoyl synthase [Candidatus Omnitrophota bacterium]|nr:lipoyl synthase [Candidatus Omnitrophota bacterium]HRZ22102.1 lipoyl synthase [Bacteroidales bacterium]
MRAFRRFPDWLRRSLPENSSERTYAILNKYRLNTVCKSAMCPNCQECYAEDTATFMILGNVCTRHCGFCAVRTGQGELIRQDEPERVAFAAKELGLRYVVITSVTRDDLSDEGAAHYANTVYAVKREIPESRVEVLTPDFHSREELIRQVVEAGPEVFNHNLETVERLQRTVRPQADYQCSLKTLEIAKRLGSKRITKSGLMLGLGETVPEILETGRHLLSVGVSILTIGQYLQPNTQSLEVQEYVTPEKFRDLSRKLMAMGFEKVFGGPYVRSSYHARETFTDLGEEKTFGTAETNTGA